MNFIKVTSTLHNKDVFINPNFIVMIGNSKGSTEFSVINSDNTYHVKETPEQIMILVREAIKVDKEIEDIPIEPRDYYGMEGGE